MQIRRAGRSASHTSSPANIFQTARSVAGVVSGQGGHAGASGRFFAYMVKCVHCPRGVAEVWLGNSWTGKTKHTGS